MAQRGCCRVMLGAVGSITFLASGALAQDFSANLAPRCRVAALEVTRGVQDPCREQFAAFGLNGPTVITSGFSDIETTGSVAPTPARPSPLPSSRGD
jgi:hypothetical protein